MSGCGLGEVKQAKAEKLKKEKKKLERYFLKTRYPVLSLIECLLFFQQIVMGAKKKKKTFTTFRIASQTDSFVIFSFFLKKNVVQPLNVE